MTVLGNIARELRREATDPLQLCKQLGIDRPHTKQARGVTVCCPSHQDKNPSCSVTKGPDGTIRCKCHACSWSADAVGLVAAAHGLDTRRDFRAVLVEFASILGRWDLVEHMNGREKRARLSAPPRRVRLPRSEPTTEELPTVSDARFDEIARAIIERCPLRGQRDVAGFVDSRSVFADAEACDCGALPPVLSQHFLVAELSAMFGADELDRVGIARRGTFVYARHRLLIPWFDRQRRIIALQRRRLDTGDPKYVWTRGRSPKVPFGADLFDDAVSYFGGDCEVIVCEGAFDAFARRKLARRREERAVVLAVPSASSSADESLLFFVEGRDVVLSLDADAAGDRATSRISNVIRRHARTLTRERVEGANDVNDVLVAEVSQ